MSNHMEAMAKFGESSRAPTYIAMQRNVKFIYLSIKLEPLEFSPQINEKTHTFSVKNTQGE